MEKLPDVLFIRLSISKADTVTHVLQAYWNNGFKVVSHCERGDEYSFVLERRPE